MSKPIEFAEKLSFPPDAATQTIAFLARKRAGKSYAAGKLAEGFYSHGTQFVVLDPVGNWWGLRVAADGRAQGLDVIILGGLRGDIPLDPNAGKLVADSVLDSGRSFVLDVSLFSLGERKRFVQAFGEQLWHRQKSLADPQPIHVFLEEAQLFIPQQPLPEERPMLGVWCEIVRLGGNKGIGVTIISQRPQSVSKEALTQVECLVVLQVSGVPEKKALAAWIVERLDTEVEVEGEKKKATDLLKELPFLKQGIAYVWSPQWLEHFGQHRILAKKTFDAGATPKAGAKKVKAEVKPLDLEELRSKMAETVKKLEENDPRALKRRVAELEKQLVKLMEVAQKQLAAKPSARVETKTVEKPVLKEKEMKLLEKHLRLASALAERLSQCATVIGAESNNLGRVMRDRFAAATGTAPGETLDDLLIERSGIRERAGYGTNGTNGHQMVSGRLASTPHFANKPKPPPSKPRLITEPIPLKIHQPSEESDGEEKRLGRGPRDMLKALASRHPTPLTTSQAATLARVKLRKSTFRNAMSSLRTAGFVREEGDLLHITEEGLAFIGDDVELVPPTTEDLLAMWGRRLPPKVNEALKILAEAHPNALTHAEFGERVSVDTSKSTYRNLLSKLRMTSLVVTTDNDVRASETLFPQ